MQEVQPENLVPSKEYYMECFTYDQNKEIIHCNPPYKMMAMFKKLDYSNPNITNYLFPHFINFRKIEFKNDKNHGYDVWLNTLWKFYEIIEDKVQTNMEKRAVDIIIKDIIKDEHFQIEFI